MANMKQNEPKQNVNVSHAAPLEEYSTLNNGASLHSTAVIEAGKGLSRIKLPRLADFNYGDRSSRISPAVVVGLTRLFEWLGIILIGMVIFAVYVGTADLAYVVLYGVSAVAVSSLAVLLFEMMQLYQITVFKTFFYQISRLAAAWTITFAMVLAVVFFAKIGDQFSRVWLATWYLTGLVALIGGRLYLSYMTRWWAQSGKLVRRAVVIGGGEKAEELIKALEASPTTDIRIAGIFDDRDGERSPPVVAGYPKLGSIEELLEFARNTRIDILLVTFPLTAQGRINEILKKLWVLPVDIRLAAHTEKLLFRPRSFSQLGNVSTIDVVRRPIADWDHVIKWFFDKIVGSLILIGVSPIMVLVALAVKLTSPGPVLFKQKRYGFNNELIEVYKFRSMYVDQTDANAAKLVTKNDPRVTPVGRFIRKTSLDELPQLFNVVFKGNLSLVGPRPHAVQAKASSRLYGDVVDGYYARHRVKPGITGWAQIHGWRGETDTEEKIKQRVAHDLYYIENWSVLLDLYILLVTPISLLRTDNAY